MEKGNVKYLLLGTFLGISVALAGCGSSSGTESYSATESAVEEAKSYDVYDNMDAEVAEMPNESADNNVTETNRKLITTVNISTETEDLNKTMSQIENKTSELGGYIESSNIYNGSAYSSNYRSTRSANYTIRIPAGKLDQFINSVDEGTNIINKSVNVDDVTLQYVDIESKKKALKTEESRLLEILEKAETVEDIITVEDKLSDVRYELESIESQLRTYDNKVDYSTVYLDVDEVTQYTPAEEKGVFQRISEGFVYNFKEVIDGILELFIWIIIHIPQIIIFVLFCLIIILIIKKISDSEKKKKEKRMQAYMQSQVQAQQYQSASNQVNTQGNNNGNQQ